MATANSVYSAVLARQGVTPAFHGPWAFVGGSAPVQAGWKLHVSAIPVEAERVLESVAAFLCSRTIPFKFARNEDILERLNAGRLGPTQVGKFITVYPAPEDVVEVAETLRAYTQTFQGPRIPSDLHLGGVIYARYGAFTPLVRRDRLGLIHRQATLPDGQRVDDVYRVPHETPAGVAIPFRTPEAVASGAGRPQGSGLIGPGYRIVGVLGENAKGATFLAINLASQREVALEVLKQGRRHCLSDRYGRDVRWRLQREHAHYQRLLGVDGVARAGSYFEVDGDGYLAVDYIEGESIEVAVDRTLKRSPWARVPVDDRASLLDRLSELATIVAAVHRSGLVHRDISPANVVISPSGGTHLIDFEMAHAIEDESPAAGLGTPGFASPDQQAGARPQFSDDVYSVACIAALVLTGVDPRRLLDVLPEDRPSRLSTLTGDAADIAELALVVAAALHPVAARRPTLDVLMRSVATARSSLDRAPPPLASSIPRSRAPTPGQLLTQGLGALETALPRDEAGIWLSLPLGLEEDEITEADLIRLRSAGRGAGGMLYLLSRAKVAGRTSSSLESAAARLAGWLFSEAESADLGLTGLHSGEDGVAVAMMEAVLAGISPEVQPSQTWFTGKLSGALDWPDLVHGAAGQGLAALICAPDLANRAASYLISTQEADGAWRLPSGFPGLSGRKLTGFAHGVAGILYFLAEYDAVFQDAGAAQAWRSGAEWLLNQASRTESGLEWPYSDQDESKWRWWCHGGPGIALAFLRLAEHSQKSQYLDVALAALAVQPREMRHGSLSQCHGLSGLGEIYLEAWRISGDEQWLDRALEIATTIGAFARRTPQDGLTWLSGNAQIATAELYLGSAGILHFLLRLEEGPRFAGFPLLSSLGRLQSSDARTACAPIS